MHVLLYFLYSPKVIKLIGSSLGITEFEIIDHGVKLCVGLCVLTNNRITLQEFIRLQHTGILPSASNSTLTEKIWHMISLHQLSFTSPRSQIWIISTQILLTYSANTHTDEDNTCYREIP